MPTDEQVMRLVLEVIGQDKVQELTNKLQKMEDQAPATGAAMVKMDAATRTLATGTDKLDDASRALIVTTNDATTAHMKMASSSEKAGSKLAGFGQSALQTGRIVQDFAQGGIPGILNNIEGASRALGGGAGLAGILTGLGVGLYVFRDQLGDISKALGLTGEKADDTAGAIGRLEARIKELNGQPVRLAVDTLELQEAESQLAKLKEDMAAFAEAGKTRTYFEKESGQEVAATIAEEAPGGEKAVRDSVKASILKELLAASAAIQDAQAEAAYYTTSAADTEDPVLAAIYLKKAEAANERERQARLKAEKDAEAKTGALFGGAKAGDVVQQQALAKRFRGVGAGALAESIEAKSPEAMKADNDQELADKREEERLKVMGEKERETARAAKKKDAEAVKAETDRQRGEHKEETEADREKKRGLVKGVAAVNKQTAEDVTAISKNTLLDEQARVMAARGRAQGVPEEQILMAVSGGIRQALVRGGMDRWRAFGAANQMATGALKDVDAAGVAAGVMQQQGQTSGQGLQNQARMIGVMQMYGAQAQQAAQVQASHSIAIDQLFQMNGRGPRRRALAKRGG